jgi:hypothetical protein
MRFVRGKRQIKQERLYGIVRVHEPRVGLCGVYFVWGDRAWGWQWKA